MTFTQSSTVQLIFTSSFGLLSALSRQVSCLCIEIRLQDVKVYQEPHVRTPGRFYGNPRVRDGNISRRRALSPPPASKRRCLFGSVNIDQGLLWTPWYRNKNVNQKLDFNSIIRELEKKLLQHVLQDGVIGRHSMRIWGKHYFALCHLRHVFEMLHLYG